MSRCRSVLWTCSARWRRRRGALTQGGVRSAPCRGSSSWRCTGITTYEWWVRGWCCVPCCAVPCRAVPCCGVLVWHVVRCLAWLASAWRAQLSGSDCSAPTASIELASRSFPAPLCACFPALQHSVGALVQLAACLPQGERSAELLSAFIELGGDPVWSVRQDCASELAAFAQQLPREAVRERLLPLWEALSGDVSAWVQAAARRQAGPLLASIHPADCSDGEWGWHACAAGTGAASSCAAWYAVYCLPQAWPPLFPLPPCLRYRPATLFPACYAALIVAFVAAAVGPATLMEACAHFLPAVVRSLGVQRWQQLRCAGGGRALAGKVIESYPLYAWRGCLSCWLVSCLPHSAPWPLRAPPPANPRSRRHCAGLVPTPPASPAGKCLGSWPSLSTCQCGQRWRRTCTSWRRCWAWS